MEMIKCNITINQIISPFQHLEVLINSNILLLKTVK